MGHFDIPQIMTSLAPQEGEKSIQNSISKQPCPYGKVVITLENILLPEEKLLSTPSCNDGLSKELETDLRFFGCELIQTAGILLKLPQVAMATGQILFQRFYYCKSFINHPVEIYAMACIYLASKIEEAPRRIRDVVNVAHHIKQVKSGKTITPVILDYNYVNLKNQIIKAERRILKELGFCVHIKHPHKIIVMYMQVLEQEKNKRFVQYAWNNMNDALRTDVFVRFAPETIANACIYLAARLLRIPLPTRPHWFEVFNAKEKDIQEICLTLLNIYRRPKPDLEKLERIVESLRKSQQEAKLRAKGLPDTGTPILSGLENFSPETPLKSSPNSNIVGKHDKDEKALPLKLVKMCVKCKLSSCRAASSSPQSSSLLDESISHSPSPASRIHHYRKDRKRAVSSPEINHKDRKHRKKKRRSRSFSPSPKNKKVRSTLSSRTHAIAENRCEREKIKSKHKSRSQSRHREHNRSHKLHKHKSSSKRSHSRDKRK